MKKLIFSILCILTFTAVSYGQDLGKLIDYQYNRENLNYHSYTVYLNDLSEKYSFDLVLTSSYPLDEIDQVLIGSGKNSIKVSFKKLKITVVNDDPTLHNRVIRINISKVISTSFPCETKITFILNKSQKIELPFDSCTLEKAVI